MAFLEIEGISKYFGGLRAVSNLSFSMEKGEILGLIGPNGAGKTTAFNMIGGYFPPDQGEIFLKGENITRMRPWSICKRGVSRTFQISRPFSDLSVLENVMVGAFVRTVNRTIARSKAEGLLEFIEMTDRQDVQAQDLTVVDRKKLELGRALATDPELLLLDEVVAGTTPREAMAMMDLIRKIRENGVTVLMVEHMMKVIMGLSDRVLVLHHGEKLADCPPEEAARNENVLRAYLGSGYVRTEDS